MLTLRNGTIAFNSGVADAGACADVRTPAIDRGNNDAGLANDQRGAGFARVSGAGADVGACEAQTGPPDPIFVDGFDA